MNNKLNAETLAKIDEIVNKHKDKRGPVKLMLHDCQEAFGYIPFEAMEKIAYASNVPVSDVYGVVTFYTQFTTEPKGKHVINVCLGAACYVKGSQELLNHLLKMTNCEVNKTSPDGLFSVDATRCLGACGLAPVVVIDGEVYGNVQDKMILAEIINGIKREEGRS